ncbi:MAG: peptidoglycan editing factor PgeF [Patescibacteria group bacterium]
MVFSQFTKYTNLKYGFSNRTDGSMHRHLEKENREVYFRKIGIDPYRVVTADLVHGTKVVRVSDEVAGMMISSTDALVTNIKNLFISVTGADCFPLYLYDPIHKAVGIAHVGWKGLVGGVVTNMVVEMAQAFGAVPHMLVVGISPGIRQCHFEVKPENAILYRNYPGSVSEREEKVFVDIPKIMKAQLRESGVKEGNIQDSECCTYCKEVEYFSFRRDKPKELQVMVGYIGLI